jgi:hypothetical protein
LKTEDASSRIENNPANWLKLFIGINTFNYFILGFANMNKYTMKKKTSVIATTIHHTDG